MGHDCEGEKEGEKALIMKVFFKYDSLIMERAELVSVLQSISQGSLRDEDIVRALKNADADVDGKVNLDRFVEWACGIDRKPAVTDASTLPSPNQLAEQTCSDSTVDAELLPSKQNASGTDKETALFEVTGLSGEAIASITFDIRRKGADLEAELATIMKVSVNHLRLSVGTEVLEDELLLKDQGIEPSSIVQVTALRVQPFFGKWETSTVKMSKSRNAGMRMQKVAAIPTRSNAIGANGFTEGVHTARFRKIRGDGDYCHIGVCCWNLGLGISLATFEEHGGGGGAWVLWDGGELRQRIGNFHWTTAARGMPDVTAAGSVFDVTLDCERKVLTFIWPSGQSGEISNLPSVPLHFVLQIQQVGDAWEAEMLE